MGHRASKLDPGQEQQQEVDWRAEQNGSRTGDPVPPERGSTEIVMKEEEGGSCGLPASKPSGLLEKISHLLSPRSESRTDTASADVPSEPPPPQQQPLEEEQQPAETPEAVRSPVARRTKRRWTEEETEKLKELTLKHGKGRWTKVLEEGAGIFQNRNQVDLKDKWRNLERQGKVPKIPGLRNPAYQGTIYLLPSPDTGAGDSDRLELLAVAAAGMKFVHHPPPSTAAVPAGAPLSGPQAAVPRPAMPPLPIAVSRSMLTGLPTDVSGPLASQIAAPPLLASGPEAVPAGAAPGGWPQVSPHSGPSMAPGEGTPAETAPLAPMGTLADDTAEEDREDIANGLLQLAAGEPGDQGTETVEGAGASLHPAGVPGGSGPGPSAVGGLLQGLGFSSLLQGLAGGRTAENQQADVADPGALASVDAVQPPSLKRKRGRPAGYRKHQYPWDKADEEGRKQKRAKKNTGVKKERRKVGHWTQLETDTLISLTTQLGRGKWKEIYAAGIHLWRARTQVDLKDKWRNLERQGKVVYVRYDTTPPAGIAAPAPNPAPAAQPLPLNLPSAAVVDEDEHEHE